MSVRDAQATVGGLQTLDLLAALGQLGLDRDELCRAAALDRQALDRPDSRIPTAQFVAILMGARPSRHEQLTPPSAWRCAPPACRRVLTLPMGPAHGNLSTRWWWY